jgi:hypothetical protein
VENVRTKLLVEENIILKSFEDGEWTPAPDSAKRKKELAQYARNTLKKEMDEMKVHYDAAVVTRYSKL